ncbi:MAG: RDD family protein [Caldimonas sp.]
MAPSLRRRMACFVYEAMILFGIGLIPGLVGAIFVAQTSHRHPWQSDAALRVFAFVVYGIYFVWFWSTRGQTLPMQTWHIRVETRTGVLPGQGHALLRYLACWVWIAPAALVASLLGWTPWQSLGGVAAWIAIYALSALLHPQRQFWHDALCRTRLSPYRPPKAA